MWQNVDRMTLRTMSMDCVNSGACDVSVYEMMNSYPANRQAVIDAIRQSGYRRQP